MKSTRILVSLDNVGCLSVVVLTLAFRWVLLLRLGWTGLLGWACGFGIAFVVVAVLVGRKSRGGASPP